MDLAAQRLAVASVVLAAALLLLPGLGHTPLVDWDEGIYAEVARGLYEDGGPGLRWNGERYDRKPPLLFFAIAAAYSVFGVEEAAVRLPSALAGLATAGIVAGVVARRSAPGAVVAGAALVGSALFLERGGRHASTDSMAILFTVASLALATSGAARWRRRAGAGLACGLAILGKGPLGLLAPAAIALARPRDPEARRDAAAVLLVGAAVAAPWYALQIASGGEAFLATHLGREIVTRAVTPIEGHVAPWWYPLWVATSGGGLWVLAALGAVLALGRTDRRAFDEAAPWTAAALLALGLAVATRTKLPWYSLPALPPLAVAGGLAFGRLWRMPGTVRAAPAALAVAGAAALFAAPAARSALLDAEREYEPVRQFRGVLASEVPDEPAIGVAFESPSLLFYGRRRLMLLDADELERLLLDPASLPRAALVAAERVPRLVESGAVEKGRLGDRVLVYRSAL